MCYKVGRFVEYAMIQEYLRGYAGADTLDRVEAIDSIDPEDDGSDEPESAVIECKKLGIHPIKVVRM